MLPKANNPRAVDVVFLRLGLCRRLMLKEITRKLNQCERVTSCFKSILKPLPRLFRVEVSGSRWAIKCRENKTS